jgi:hypothetical protein
MTTREIEGHLKEMYGVEVSPTLIGSLPRLCVWHEFGCPMFSLLSGLPSTTSCGPPRPSFGCFIGTDHGPIRHLYLSTDKYGPRQCPGPTLYDSPLPFIWVS